MQSQSLGLMPGVEVTSSSSGHQPCHVASPSVLPPSPPYPYILFFLLPSCPQPRTVPPTFSPGRVAHLAGADAHQSPGCGFESRTESQFSDWRWEIIRKRGGGRFLSTLRGWFLLPVRGGGESVLVVFFLYCCIGTLDIVLPS
jgi:hypothetical protein